MCSMSASAIRACAPPNALQRRVRAIWTRTRRISPKSPAKDKTAEATMVIIDSQVHAYEANTSEAALAQRAELARSRHRRPAGCGHGQDGGEWGDSGLHVWRRTGSTRVTWRRSSALIRIALPSSGQPTLMIPRLMTSSQNGKRRRARWGSAFDYSDSIAALDPNAPGIPAPASRPRGTTCGSTCSWGVSSKWAWR